MSSVELLFCGDFAPNTNIDEYKPNDSFLFSIKDLISSHDLAFLNVEAPFTTEKNKLEKNGPNLKISKSFLDPLLASGFNLFGLANNHIMDYGQQGLYDTLELLKENHVDYVGAGESLNEASEVYYFEKGNVKIAVIAVAEREFSIASLNEGGVAPLDICHNYYQITKAKEKADVVIVTMHAGNEHFPLPRPNLRKLCHLYIDLGVDLIVNHHTHVSSAYEEYKGKKIYYGIGNFIFNLPNKSKAWNEGYMVTVNVKTMENKELTLTSNIIPFKQSTVTNGVEILKDYEKVNFFERLDLINDSLYDEESYRKAWSDFCESKKRQYFLSAFFPFSFRGIGLLEKTLGISNWIMNRRTFPVKLNMLECESHQEVLVNLLKKGK